MEPNLIWIDLEMTGLDPETAVIVEIATIVTDGELNPLARGPEMAVAQGKAALDRMDDWSREHHEASGLMDRVRASTTDMAAAEEATLEFLSRHCKPGESPLCGNSVWQDRRFLVKYMPRLNEFLHHRLIDVSTLKELVRRWYPGLPPYEKRHTHTALSDILESVAELKYYREKIFIPQ